MLSVTILFMLMILLSTLSARRHLIYGLETGGTEDWGRKWLVDFNAENTWLVSFDQSNITGSIDVKMDGFVIEEKPSFKMLLF